MKNNMWKKLSGYSKLLFLAVLLFGCVEDPVLWDVNSRELVIAEFVAENPEYSEFAKILEATKLTSLLSVRGPFTLFLPSDEVLREYYTSKGVNSFEDFTDTSFIYTLVKNLLIVNEIRTGDIGHGAIRDTNGLGDYIVTEFDEDNGDIILNKQSRIIKRDIQVANGFIHLIDKVIDPVTATVYDAIKANPSFSLFAQGLEKTGLKDTLQVVSFPYGSRMVRSRITALAVPDTIFNRYGINTIDELIAYFTDAPDSVTYLENPFYRYMEYHCLNGTHFLNNFTTKLYPIFSSDNNISVKIDNDYRLNIDKITQNYTTFIRPESNIPAKNGTIHVLTDLLPVVDPEPVTITVDVCEFFDMMQGDYYMKYYRKWYDGQNTFKNIKWEGDYLQYYYKNHDAPVQVNYDGLNLFGWWWVEVTTPKIMKGHYTLSGYIWGGPQYICYVDGVQTANITTGDYPALGEFIWTKTEEHTVRLVATISSTIFWDTLVFTPVK